LVGYVVADSSRALTASELRKYLKTKLPEYMVPSALIGLDRLPLNANGKVDRSALPAPQIGGRESEGVYAAPRSVNEQRLAQIWAEVLKVERVGVHDNFFIAGGHSLLAIRLLSLMSKEFEFEIPLRSFLESPTIASVAKYIDARNEQEEGTGSVGKHRWSYLVKLKGGEGKSTVFVFPGGFGGENEALALAQIAYFAGPEYTFYGLRARSAGGTVRGHESVQEMAKDFLEEIRKVQPRGPYYLLGHCLGGVVAYEVACQLQDQGNEVGLLGFLDTVRPTTMRYYRYLAWRVIEKLIPNWQYYYRERFFYHLEKVRTLGWRDKIRYLTHRSRTLAEVFDLKPRKAAVGTQQPSSLRALRTNQSSHIKALMRYRPRQYHGRVFSLVAAEVCNQKEDNALGWGEHITGGIETYRGTGDHDSFIRDHTRTVGALIREWLENSQRQTAQSE
jgi:thioesterase domain-containing protein/acyl carrier protein